MWYGSGDGWSWLWMSGAGVLLLIGVVFVLAWAARASSPNRLGEDAMEVLRRRLAAGEITPEEFEKTRKVLGA